MRITFATGNPGKIREARERLEPLGIELDQWDGGYPEVQADTLEEVATFGCQVLLDELEPPFMVEDAGLFVEGLGGFPGVYSSYVFKTLGNEGILRLLQGRGERAASFKAVIGYHDGERIHLFEGAVHGHIASEPTGSHGFGFDPIFVPGEHGRTFGEMSVEQKGGLSHRSNALDQLVAYLEKARDR